MQVGARLSFHNQALSAANLRASQMLNPFKIVVASEHLIYYSGHHDRYHEYLCTSSCDGRS